MAVIDINLQKSRQFAKWQATEDFVDLKVLPGLKFDLRYSGANNFVGVDIYGPVRTAYLHREAFAMLKAAQTYLHTQNNNLDFVIFDALRPRSAQWVLFNKVKGTEYESYVADPKQGSVHNFGFAVDLSLCNKTGEYLDMGTEFDDFTDLAQPRYEDKFLQEGSLIVQQLENRKLLRTAMLNAGFESIPNEWWHFNGRPWAALAGQYLIIE